MSDCILSTTNKNHAGYGRVTHQGTVMNEHRVVFAQYNNIAVTELTGLVVRHKCDNPGCVNPQHLELGTQKDNCADKKARGRPNGGGAPRSLTDEQLAEIRAVFRPNQYQLAAKYNVSQPTINNVLMRKKAYSKR